MKSFQYTILDELGIHARPAGLLVREAKKYQSAITIQKEEKSIPATQLIKLMGMAIKKGETITLSFDGADEDAAFQGMQAFFEQYHL